MNSILNLVVLNMTMVDGPANMAAMFDGNGDSCTNNNDIIDSQSHLKSNMIDSNPGNVAFDVKVQGVNLCSDYEFLYALVKDEPCDFVRSCNVTHVLGTSHNSCIVNCHCEDNCDIVVIIHSLITTAVGSVCEIMLL